MKKIFSREVIIGITGILAILIIYLLINFFKGINLFKAENHYYVRFSDVCQLVNSSPVFINGYSVGNVRNINYDYANPGNIIVTIEIDERMKVPMGSYATITTHMLGGTDISLVLGNSGNMLTPGDTLAGYPDKGIATVASEKILPAFDKMLPKLDSILGNLNTLLANPSLNNTVDNAAMLTEELKKTTAGINKLIAKDVPAITDRMIKLEDDMLAVSGQLKQIDYKNIASQLENTLRNIEQLTIVLNSKEGTMGLLLNDTALYRNLCTTCEQATALLQNLREEPKRYVHFSLFGRKDKK
ncbi:MAG: MCE family protein [Bacteroidaceae bacterium]|nr:MCE family protein [Bacteroidaceae bacterium]